MPARNALSNLAVSYRRVASEIEHATHLDPERLRDAYVVRNEVGNLSIMNVDGAYIGYIDTLTGEVDIF
jgi:hypothetical protein